jgi:FKBP-type peptidyl-prolyl cis-trans isomerase SlyD
MSPDKVMDDVVVAIHYKLWVDGEMVEESEDGEPLVYLHGHENIIPGLESELAGLTVGETKTVEVEPSDAYGEYDESEVDVVSRSELPPDFEPQKGMLLTVTDTSGEEFMAHITDMDGDNVTLDFNHPMAGKALKFEVTIKELREPSAEELDHGHVHAGDHHHH